MGAVDRKGYKLVAPDGGWGWMAVVGVMMVNVSNCNCHMCPAIQK
jgi:hypothetical protein